MRRVVSGVVEIHASLLKIAFLAAKISSTAQGDLSCHSVARTRNTFLCNVLVFLLPEYLQIFHCSSTVVDKAISLASSISHG